LLINVGIYKKHAEWISKELNADIYDIRNFDAALFFNYNLVVLGRRSHEVNIKESKTIKQTLPKLKNKKS
jgi:hypothetical protein